MVYGIIPTSIKLEPTLKERVKKLAEATQRKPHALMKEAIILYLKREEKIEQLRQEIVARWDAVTHGKTINHMNISAWLDTWGTDKETERPSCKD